MTLRGPLVLLAFFVVGIAAGILLALALVAAAGMLWPPGELAVDAVWWWRAVAVLVFVAATYLPGTIGAQWTAANRRTYETAVQRFRARAVVAMLAIVTYAVVVSCGWLVLVERLMR